MGSLAKITDRLDRFSKPEGEAAKNLTDSIKSVHGLEDFFNLVLKSTCTATVATTALTAAGATAGTVALTPVAIVGLASVLFLIKQRADRNKQREERDRYAALDLMLVRDKRHWESACRWASDNLGIEGLKSNDSIDFLAKLLTYQADGINEELRTNQEELLKASQMFFNGLAAYLKPKLAEVQEELSQLRSEMVALGRLLQGIDGKVQVLLDANERSQITLELRRQEPPNTDIEYLYFQQATAMLGREEEMCRLREFCDHAAPFRFWIIGGAGGVGKTRLAHELCLEYELQGWYVGFLTSDDNPKWSAWQPQRDTLIVVDYFTARNLNWKEGLKRLGTKTSGRKVRLLMVERTADANAWATSLTVEDHKRFFHGNWHTEGSRNVLECLAVTGLNTDTLTSLFSRFRPWPTDESLAWAVSKYEGLDAQRRPLFALMAADALHDALQANQPHPQWTFDEFIAHILDKLFDRWAKAGIDRAHLYLLALATMIGRVDLKPEAYAVHATALGDLVPAKPNRSQCRTLAAFTGEWNLNDESLPKLLPDALGEAFVIAMLSGTWQKVYCSRDAAKPEDEWTDAELQGKAELLVRHSEAMSVDLAPGPGSPFLDFLRRTATDFPDRLYLFTVITALDLSAVKMASYAWLKQFVNLSVLNLWATTISNISDIGGIASLTTLNLGNTLVSDLGPICKFKNLTWLNLGGTTVVDISVLSVLTNLQYLGIAGSSISDLSSLASMPDLAGLVLSGTNVTDLAPLAMCPKLTDLDFAQTPVNDISALAAITKIETLTLYGTGVVDLSPVRGLCELRRLGIWDTNITDLSALSGLCNVTSLLMISTPVKDISPLSSLCSLRELSLGWTQVRDLSPLRSLSSLVELTLQQTQVEDLSPLAALTSLAVLDASDTNVKDISQLNRLSGLVDLDLDRTPVADLSGVEGMTSLEDLRLRATKVEDVRPLSELPALKTLDLDNTPVSDIRPLANLTSLTGLRLYGTNVSSDEVHWLRSKLPRCLIVF